MANLFKQQAFRDLVEDVRYGIEGFFVFGKYKDYYDMNEFIDCVKRLCKRDGYNLDDVFGYIPSSYVAYFKEKDSNE